MKLSLAFVVLLFSLCSTQGSNPSPSQENEERLRAALFTKYNKEILPVHDPKNPVVVSVGFSPLSINGINAETQTMDVECWMLFRWNDSRISWDPKEYGDINRLRIHTDRLWTPDVTLYNGANLGYMEWVQGSKSVHTLVDDKGLVTWVPATTLKAFCDLDMSRYPYDTHTCSFKFGSWVYDGYHIDLSIKGGIPNMNPMDLSNLRNKSEWTVIRSTVEKRETVYQCCPEPYPDVTFNMTIIRQAPVFQAAVLSPVVAGVILALVAYLSSPFKNTRLFLNAFNMLIFMFTLFQLQYLMPSVGTKTPYIVMICEGMMLLLAVSMSWSVFVLAVVSRCRRSKTPQVLDRFLNGWPTKVLFISTGNVSMQECCKKASDINQGSNKDAEMLSIVSNDIPSSSGWMKFILFLDRLSFVVVSVAVITLVTVFTN